MEALIPYAPGWPIRRLERTWLICTVAYEEFDENLMADTDWDLMGKELHERRKERTPYFRQCLPSRHFNTGTTGSGIHWDGPVTKWFHEEMAQAKGNLRPIIERYSRG